MAQDASSAPTPTPEIPVQDYPEPIRIVSDVHLGHPACIVRDPKALGPILEGASTVIFNGDTAELRFRSSREEGLKHIEQLKEICALSRVTPVFVNGNHDPQISDLNHLDLANGRVLVTHGDLLYRDIAPWSKESAFLRKAHDEALAGIGPDGLNDFEARLSATKRASIAYELREPHIPQGTFARIVTHMEALWPPTRPMMIFRVWMETPGRADMLAYAFRPRAKFVLIGHTHWAGVWQASGRYVINTGGYLSVLGRNMVEIANGQLSVFRVRKSGNTFEPGRLISSFSLEDVPAYS